MNMQELKDALQIFYDNFDEIGVSVYAVLKDSEGTPVKIDIENAAIERLKALFIESMKEAITERDELSILNLSSSDERVNAIYIYDIDIPEELEAIDTILTSDEIPLLNIEETGLTNIKALLIEIGNNIGQIVLYKTMAPVNIYGRKSFFLKKSNTRLEQINDEFLRISPNFQLMRIQDKLLVLDLVSIERSFGFHEVIKREASSGIEAVESMRLVENMDVLHELLDDIKYARRFVKVAKSSPVIRAAIPNNQIIEFCKSFPQLSGKIRFNESEDKILLDTKVSKDLFIKLMMDDFLTSELTSYHYASVAKDSIDDE